MSTLIYKRPNRRKCYWLCKDCLKGHNKCSTRCPGYLSVAQAKRIQDEKAEALQLKGYRL